MDRKREKYFTFLWAGVLMAVCLMPTVSMGAQSASRVQVRVLPIDELSISDATKGIQLSLSGAPGTNVLIGEPDQTARLSYAHNAPVNKKITAQVKPENMPSGVQDITLSVTVSGGAAQAVVQDGVAQGARDVLSGIGAGAREDIQVRYNATATALGSGPGDYTFMVTFTSLDDD